MKRKLLSMILSLSLVITAIFSFPLTTYAAESYKPYSNKGMYNVDNVNYFDVYGTEARDTSGGDSAFLRKTLTGKTDMHPSIDGKDSRLDGSTLTNWVGIARYLYRDRVDKIGGALGNGIGTNETRTIGYTTMLDYNNDSLSVFDTPRTPMTVGNGTIYLEHTGTTTLQEASTMKDADDGIRQEVANAGEAGSDISKFVGQPGNSQKGNLIYSLNDDLRSTNSSSPVFYDTSLLKVNHTGSSGANKPDVVLGTAVVFYDFNLHYINTPDARSALSESQVSIGKDEIRTPDLIYIPNTSSSSPKHVAAAENITSLPVEISQSVSSSTETTVENSWEKSKDIGFEEMIGAETNIEAGALFAKAAQSFKLEFKASQTFTSSEGSSTSNTTTSERSNDITVPLPPYTALMLEQSESNSSLMTKYDYPVAVSYKVKVTGIVAETRGTDTFINTTLATFGKPVSGHTTAIDNLKKRVEHSPTEQGGFENTYGDRLPTELINGINSTVGSGNVIGNYYNSLINFRPMSVNGGEFNVNAKSVNSKVYGISPISPLNKISLDKAETLKMTKGDELYVDNIPLNAYNTAGAPYYGFHSSKGEWRLVDKDSNPYAGDLVTLEQDPVSKYSTLAANEGSGTVYLKYFINDNTYSSADQIETYGVDSPYSYTSNDDLSQSATLKINVAERVKDIKVEAKGSLTGYVDDEPIILEDSNLDACVYEDGKILDFPVIWEAQDLRAKAGIKIEDNRMSFTKAGEYSIRATYDGKVSDWVTVKALPADQNPKNKDDTPIEIPKENIFNAVIKSVKDISYTGKIIQPNPVVSFKGTSLRRNIDYKVSYKNNKEIGKASIIITGIGKYEGTKTINFKIVPCSTTISNKSNSGKIKVTWKKVPKKNKITKYQIRYKIKGSKKWKIKEISTKKNHITLKKLKKGKVYKIQVRSYKKISKVKYYSAWSKSIARRCK